MKFNEIHKKDGSFKNIRETDHCPAFIVREVVDEFGNIIDQQPNGRYNNGKYDPNEVDSPDLIDMSDPVSAASVSTIEANIGALPSSVNPMDMVDTAREIMSQV